MTLIVLPCEYKGFYNQIKLYKNRTTLVVEFSFQELKSILQCKLRILYEEKLNFIIIHKLVNDIKMTV